MQDRIERKKIEWKESLNESKKQKRKEKENEGKYAIKIEDRKTEREETMDERSHWKVAEK